MTTNSTLHPHAAAHRSRVSRTDADARTRRGSPTLSGSELRRIVADMLG